MMTKKNWRSKFSLDCPFKNSNGANKNIRGETAIYRQMFLAIANLDNLQLFFPNGWSGIRWEISSLPCRIALEKKNRGEVFWCVRTRPLHLTEIVSRDV